MTAEEFRSALAEKLKTFDRKGAEEICEKLVDHLYQSETQFDVVHGAGILQDLRRKRMFDLMLRVGDALIIAERANYTIRKLYAQALIDKNYLNAGLCIVNHLIFDTYGEVDKDMDAKKEWIEAQGLLGRIFKQLYINAGNGRNSKIRSFLLQSIQAYYKVYEIGPDMYTWHGINAVALLLRAKRDSVEVIDYPKPETLAAEILKSVQGKYNNEKAEYWDFAIAAEACIALDKPKEALEWISGYARMPYTDAFELASTLRQMEEVWQLDVNSEMGRMLLPIVRAELLKRQGGVVTIDANDVQQQKEIEGTYKKIVAQNTVDDSSETLEKVFGDDSFNTYEWYKTGSDRCLAIARIGREATKGFGTGFLVQGKELHEKLNDELILLTNAHVVSEDPNENALLPGDVVVVFEVLNSQERFKVSEIFWSSSSKDLDATILRFDEENHRRLTELTKNVSIYPVASRLPGVNDRNGANRIYIIGHPAGGTLQLSLHDNVLLDHEDPLIHYRTPTVGGSSGSPVFNHQWDLIGLHHAGSKVMRMLNGKTGTYEANEGIWIQAIKRALKEAKT